MHDVHSFLTPTLQGGTEGEDYIIGGSSGENGTVFLVGSTTGIWSDVQANQGYDFAGVQLSLDSGTELWRWQVFMHVLY